MGDDFIWIGLGFAASLFNTAFPLIQEKFKGDGFAVAIWVKIAVVVLSLPLVLYFGFPEDPRFYLLTAVSASIWCINDVIYFRTVPVVGAGVVTRILPASVVISFVVWFFFEPSLLQQYFEHPAQGISLFAIVILSSFFAMSLKSCPLSWQGVRMLWFVVLAAAIGPLIDKISLGQAPAAQAPFAFLFVQAVIMLTFWGGYTAIRRPISRAAFFAQNSKTAGLAIGTVATFKLILKFTALRYCENPAFLSVILFTDALWIILYYRLTGREDHSKIWAGLGIVGCAAALILVKSLKIW